MLSTNKSPTQDAVELFMKKGRELTGSSVKITTSAKDKPSKRTQTKENKHAPTTRTADPKGRRDPIDKMVRQATTPIITQFARQAMLQAMEPVEQINPKSYIGLAFK